MSKIMFPSSLTDNGRRGLPMAGCDCEQCFGYCLIDREEEARMFLNISLIAESPEAIARRTGQNKDEAARLLERMAEKVIEQEYQDALKLAESFRDQTGEPYMVMVEGILETTGEPAMHEFSAVEAYKDNAEKITAC